MPRPNTSTIFREARVLDGTHMGVVRLSTTSSITNPRSSTGYQTRVHRYGITKRVTFQHRHFILLSGIECIPRVFFLSVFIGAVLGETAFGYKSLGFDILLSLSSQPSTSLSKLPASKFRGPCSRRIRDSQPPSKL